MIILVYDISKKSSFDSIKNYWLPEAQSLNSDAKFIIIGIFILIIGNKID